MQDDNFLIWDAYIDDVLKLDKVLQDSSPIHNTCENEEDLIDCIPLLQLTQIDSMTKGVIDSV